MSAGLPLQRSEQGRAACAESSEEQQRAGRAAWLFLSPRSAAVCGSPSSREALSAVTGFFLWLTPITEVRPHGLSASLTSARQLLSAWKPSYPNTCEMKGTASSRSRASAGREQALPGRGHQLRCSISDRPQCPDLPTSLPTHIHQAPGPIKQGRQGHLLVWSFSINLTQFDYFHRDIAKAEHQKCRKAMFTAIKDPTTRQTWLPASEHSPARSVHCKGAQKPSHEPRGALCLQPTWGCFGAAHSWQHVCALCKCRVVEKVEVFVLLSNLRCSWVI